MFYRTNDIKQIRRFHPNCGLSNKCLSLQIEEPEVEVVEDETCAACLLLMEYGVSESDLDSLEPCLLDLSDRDDSSDLRLDLEGYYQGGRGSGGCNGEGREEKGVG